MSILKESNCTGNVQYTLRLPSNEVGDQRYNYQSSWKTLHNYKNWNSIWNVWILNVVYNPKPDPVFSWGLDPQPWVHKACSEFNPSAHGGGGHCTVYAPLPCGFFFNQATNTWKFLTFQNFLLRMPIYIYIFFKLVSPPLLGHQIQK